MFKVKEKVKSAVFAADSISTVAAGMKIIGDIESEHDMRIDGVVEGNIYCKAKVVLGHNGKVNGDLQTEYADIFGTVNGNVIVHELLCLKSKSVINGNLHVGRLDIEPEAEFNGQCTMGHTVSAPRLLMSDNVQVLESQAQ